MKYKENWKETKEKWCNYWQQCNKGRPLMCVVARKPEIENAAKQPETADICRSEGRYYCLPQSLLCRNTEEKYLKAEKIVGRYRHFCETHEFLGESFPNMNVDFGPGCLAAYLGADIVFREDTIWIEKGIEEWEGVPEFTFNENSVWFKKHIQLAKECRKLAGNDFYVCIPDLMENLDVIAALRGVEATIYDMVDEPDELKKRIAQIQKIYFDYYNSFYQIVRNEEDNGSAYMVFQIWGVGKTAKLQCDFGAMMSPDDFRYFILDSLQEQAVWLDNVVYHLDGPDNIKHLDAVLEVEGINAIQWTSGDAGPDGTLEKWDIIYDKAVDAGKSLWIKVYSGEFKDWVKNAERLVKRYGSQSLFFHFPEMSLEQGRYLLDYAEKNWRNIKGSYK